jgi:oligosaccharide reducing-end xylanase
MPAYYELWAQATGDSFWTEAAESARAYWKLAAHPTTGLMPVRAHFDGTPVAEWDTFAPEAYRTHLNMALDQIWFDSDAWLVEESERLLGFFTAEGIADYGKEYTLDGATVVNAAHDVALVAANGTTALIATTDDRLAFIQAVWDIEPPTGPGRYYSGVLYLLALLTLSGEYRVY